MDDYADANSAKKICAIIEERDIILLIKEVKIKYHKDAIEAAECEDKQLEKDKNKIAEEDKAVDKQLEQLTFINESQKMSQDIGFQSLLNHQILEKMVTEELDVKRQRTKRVEEEFQDIYIEVKTKLTENPLYKKSQAARVNFLKVDMQRHNLEVNIRNKKQIEAERAAFQKKIYYNFWIRIAKNYLAEKKRIELKNLQMQELMAIKKLYTLQENAKLRRKLGTPGDKMKSMTKINFGSQEPTSILQKSTATSKPAERTQPIQAPQSIGEKLNSLYQQDEPKQTAIPQKIRIIEEKVLVPAFVAPQFPEFKKRKAQTIDLSKKLLNMVKNHRSMTRVSSSQSSQNSQLDQKAPENEVRVEQATLQPTLKIPLTESYVENNLPVKYTQESQKMPPIFMKNNVTAKCSQETEMSLAQTSESTPNQYQMPPIFMKNNVAAKYSQESEKTSLGQTSESTPNQYQMVEGMNQENELMQIGHSPEPNSPTVHVQSSNRLMKPQSMLSSPDTKLPHKGIIKPPEIAPKMPFGESKSVRFNMEWGHEPKESKGMFDQPMFGNSFGSFMSRPVPKQNAQNDSLEQATNMNSSFEMSMMDNTGEDFRAGMEFDSGGNVRSPDFSYNMEAEEEHPFKARSFGGGFSFQKPMFPF